ncbi:hypothetical protein [Actinomadura nitritigenes]|uniref:hypothetical protein n=1 Tax=Actinomadura nitritigenes TaxID=134602 RepID=UPI003D92A1D5
MRAPFRRFTAAALGAGLAALALTGLTRSASADDIPPGLDFGDCPTPDQLPAGYDPAFALCTVTVIGGGELKIGSIDQTITQPIKMTWANGYDPVTLEQWAVFGPMRAEPQRVKGGVLGIDGSDFIPLLQISAQPQLAADPELSPEGAVALRLKLKIKTINPLLGDTCFIGSDADPIVLNLTYATTDPPPPNKPITGTGPHVLDNGVLASTPVDNAFAVPRSSGCGWNGILNGIADFRAGLPSPAGTNTAVFESYSKYQNYPSLAKTSAKYRAK